MRQVPSLIFEDAQYLFESYQDDGAPRQKKKSTKEKTRLFKPVQVQLCN